MKRLIFTIFILFSLSLAAAPAEYRAMWVTRYELTSTKNIDELISKAVSHNFNTLFVQVCGRGTAFYDSALLPKDSSVPSFDPLSEVLSRAQKKNIEIHAWVNTLYVWSNKEKPQAPEHVLNQHQNWLLCYGQNTDGSYFLNPALPEVRQHVTNICLEIAKKYPVAGVHLDYTRLPGKKFSSNDEIACRDFEKKNGVDPRALLKNKEVAIRLYGQEEYKEYLAKWDQYNRTNINILVKEISQSLAKEKPNVLLSAAVVADYELANNNYYQDWAQWLADGYVDLIVPMAYSTREDVVHKQIVFATQLAEKYDRSLLIGLGAWQQSPERIIKHIRYTQKIREQLKFGQLAGVVLFSYDKIKENNYLEKLQRKIFTEQIARPELPINKNRFAEDIEKQKNKNEDTDIDLKYHSNIIG